MDLGVLHHFLDFWVQDGDFRTQMRVFTITIGQVFAYPIDKSATVVLNKFPPREMTKNLILLLSVAFLLLYMCFHEDDG